MKIKIIWHTFMCTLDGEGTCFTETCDYINQNNCPSACFGGGVVKGGLHVILRDCIYGAEKRHIVEGEYKRVKYDEDEGVVTFGNKVIELDYVDYLSCDGIEYIVDGDRLSDNAQRQRLIP